MTGVQKAWAKQMPADLARIAELEVANAGCGDVHVWAPRDKCSWTTEQLCEHSRLLDRKGPSA